MACKWRLRTTEALFFHSQHRELKQRLALLGKYIPAQGHLAISYAFQSAEAYGQAIQYHSRAFNSQLRVPAPPHTGHKVFPRIPLFIYMETQVSIQAHVCIYTTALVGVTAPWTYKTNDYTTVVIRSSSRPISPSQTCMVESRCRTHQDDQSTGSAGHQAR